MKFTKFGKALLMSVLCAGVVLGITSCVQSYSVGYLYVTGTSTAQTNGVGIVSGFKIDHNTGNLTPIVGLPVASGGANPVRALLLSGGRFIYVLNRGVSANPAGSSICTTEYPCQSNITQFAIGGNGVLTPQETFYPQGLNSMRITTDAAGKNLYVLDHDSSYNNLPSSSTNPNPNCALALGSGVTTCGDITAFQIDSTTGRLNLVVDAQVTSSSGTALPYFPLPSNPIDFLLTGGDILTMFGTPSIGDSIFPYTQNTTNGQLSLNSNSSQPLTVNGTFNGLADNATAIVAGGSTIYVLDNDPISVNGNVASQSQILPYTLGANGALQASTSGPIPDDSVQSNPIYLIEESKNKWLYVANQGNNTTTTGAASSGITGYIINNPPQPTQMPGPPFTTGSGPQCMLEDPSDQFIYTANYNDSTVTGNLIDESAGLLRPLSTATHAKGTYPLNGPATWCLVTGRTS